MAQSIVYAQATGQPSADAGHVLLPTVVVRCLGALLALSIAAAHVADQGGVGALTSPTWLGWAYRLIEVGGVLTAVAMLAHPARFAALPWLAGVLLAAGPAVGYLLSRIVGLPQDTEDIGNWSDWVGTVALSCELALIMLSAGMLFARHRGA